MLDKTEHARKVAVARGELEESEKRQQKEKEQALNALKTV